MDLRSPYSNAATLLLLLLPLDSCKESATEPAHQINLVRNGSFESEGMPDLTRWTFGNPQLARSVNEAAPDGGAWCLELTADWAPTTGYAYALFPELRNGDVIRVTAFVRAVGSYGGGAIQIGGRMLALASAVTTDTVWTLLSLTDTLALPPGDTATVTLSSLHTEIVPRKGLFDLVTVERISEE